MPNKRKSSLSRNTKKSKLIKLWHAAETPTGRSARLEEQQVRQAAARAAETGDEHQVRLQADQARHIHARVAESPSQRQVRQLQDRTQHVTATARAWQAKVNDAFTYDSAIVYEDNLHRMKFLNIVILHAVTAELVDRQHSLFCHRVQG